MISLSGRYTLNTRIRETSYADLYRGRRESDGVPVVVKVLRSERPSPAELARLRHEHAILTSLHLPQVVRAFALEPFGHGLALVLEDAGDVSLDMLIQAGPVPLGRALEIAISIADLLASVHQEDIVHKDIKPHHLFLRGKESNAVTLIDFGIAMRLPRQLQAALPLTRLEGSLPYIAPEQTGRMNRVIDRRSDLYSLGVTLFELLTGRLPFETTDALELVHSHIARKPPAACDVRPEIPAVVSAIIAKLLAKEAEHRYQSAEGLRYDLAECLAELTARGRACDIAPFPLAQRDATGELRIAQKLYGRQAELDELGAALERVEQGASELFLLSGPSGVGKSALVGELRRRLVRKGRMVSGKFDQLGRGVPYAALARACADLVDLLLGEPPEILGRARQALVDALGPNGQIMIDLAPNLRWVIGPQPSVPVLGPAESQRRFERTFENFLGVFCTAEHPLLLFVDDLQWADPASLHLLRLVLTGRHRLILGAYRSNEVGATHPLTFALEEIKKDGTRVRELAVEPLGLSLVAELLSETLTQPQAEVEPLAGVLVAKTQGNPFFLNQFLTRVYHEGLLGFDSDRGQWTWDQARIEGMLVTDNVVDLLLAQLRKLSLPAQEALRLAACIGNQFDGPTLGVISSRTPADLGSSLWEAMRHGLIVPLDSNFRFAADLDTDTPPAQDLTARYRFLHDRVQQAAYALIGDADQAEIHLRIGRLLVARCGGEPCDDELFAAVDHLDRGEKLVTEPEERERLARLNLRAGRKARDAAAPAAAVRYLEVALRLLGDGAWVRHYDMAFPAHLTKAECEYLCRNAGEALRLLDVAEANAQGVLDRVTARNLRTVLLTTVGRAREACENSVESLRLLGVDLPAPDDKAALGAAIGAQFGGYQAALAGRPIESLADLPLMSAPERLAVMETLANLIPPAYMANPELHALAVIKAVAETLAHGTAPVSPFFYVQYAIAHMTVTGEMSTAYRFGRLGIDLSARVGSPALAGPAHFVFGALIAHLREPMSVALEHLRLGLKLSLELGDALHASMTASIMHYHGFLVGFPLERVESEISAAEETARRYDDVTCLQYAGLGRQTIRALRGQTEHIGSFDGEGFDEAAFVKTLTPPAQALYAQNKTQLEYLAGHCAEALVWGEACPPMPCTPGIADLAFYRALALAELCRGAEAEDRQRLLERVDAEASVLAVWDASAPCNYAARYHLVVAEAAASRGDVPLAMGEYDQAIAGAQEEGFVHIEAVANEVCGRFHLAGGRTTIARAYLKEALYAYQRWGATAKVKQLRGAYPRLLDVDGPARPIHRLGAASATFTTTEDESDAVTTRRYGGRLDVATAIRATEALATELVFDKVLERLMRTLLENAGAERGSLVLDRKGSLRVEATITIDPDAVSLGLSEDVETSEALSRAIVHYVARTAQPLVLGDASRDPRFASDPYVARAEPKSVLAVPMLHRAKLTGVLYLENNTTTDAFGPARAELLLFLAVQAAAAFENARLYGELNAASEALRRANETLEAQVAQRTEELRRAWADLWSEMDLARKVQTVLLPRTTRLGDYELAATMIPAESVGGDYYDIVPGEGGGWIMMGDVSGHGVPAGLVSMMVQTAVRALLVSAGSDAAGISPATLLSRANLAIWNNLERIGEGQYMTIMALAVTPGRVRYSGLHQDILVYRRATATVERAETRGIWLGLEKDISGLLEDDTLELGPGDTLLLFTDGLSEIQVDGRMLGPELPARLCALASQGLEPGAIVQGILEPISGRSLPDDVTVMALRYAPPVPP
jgi:predicted ATPase/serine phosphatase RsbU (regulator of sigma subunit)